MTQFCEAHVRLSRACHALEVRKLPALGEWVRKSALVMDEGTGAYPLWRGLSSFFLPSNPICKSAGMSRLEQLATA